MVAAVQLSSMNVKELFDHLDYLERESECVRAVLKVRQKQEEGRARLVRAAAAADEADARRRESQT